MSQVLSPRKKLLAAVHIFVSETGIPITTVGKQACGDQSVFARIENGGDVLTGTMEKIYDWMAGERAERAARESGA